jgi:hypothetical protein
MIVRFVLICPTTFVGVRKSNSIQTSAADLDISQGMQGTVSVSHILRPPLEITCLAALPQEADNNWVIRGDNCKWFILHIEK